MSFLGRGTGRVRRLAAAGVAAGSLFAFQSLALAPNAVALPSCTITGSTLVVAVTTALDEAIVGADENGQIWVSTNGAAFTACAGVLTIATTTAITVSGGDGNQRAEITMYEIDETVAPGLGGHASLAVGGEEVDWGTINWTVTGGTSTSDNDVLSIYNALGDTALNLTAGATGIDLTTDGDKDIDYSGIETLSVTGVDDFSLFDSVTGAGDTATGSAVTTKMAIFGLDGDDSLVGGNGNDSIVGGFGDDTVDGGLGDDFLNGGSGVQPGPFFDDGTADTVDYSSATAGVIANLQAGVATGGGGTDTLALVVAGNNSFERAVGTDSNDTITGDDQTNRLSPGLGDDTVDGLLPSDQTITVPAGGTPAGAVGDTINYSNVSESTGVTIDLDAGTATGGAGNDTLKHLENARGSQGDDTFVDNFDADAWFRGQGGNDVFDQGGDPSGFLPFVDVMDGESGRDTVDYSQRSQALVVDLNTGSTAAGTVKYVCNGITDPAGLHDESGDAFDVETDMITDVENANLGSGDDTFNGNDFNNNVFPGDGQNSLEGCRGINSLNYSTRESKVTANLSGGGPAGAGDSATDFQNATGSKFNDTLLGSDIANQLKGGKGDDSISGNGGADFTIGGNGNDSIRSGSGDDTLKGGRGGDNLRGGSGDDDLVGGKGKDTCDGGSGSDFLKGCESKKSKASKAQRAAVEARLVKLG